MIEPRFLILLVLVLIGVLTLSPSKSCQRCLQIVDPHRETSQFRAKDSRPVIFRRIKQINRDWHLCIGYECHVVKPWVSIDDCKRIGVGSVVTLYELGFYNTFRTSQTTSLSFSMTNGQTLSKIEEQRWIAIRCHQSLVWHGERQWDSWCWGVQQGATHHIVRYLYKLISYRAYGLLLIWGWRWSQSGNCLCPLTACGPLIDHGFLRPD